MLTKFIKPRVQMNRALLSNEAVNSYGFRVLTAGIDLSRYLMNPVITDQHDKDDMSVGKMTDLQVDGTDLTGMPEFDIDDPKGKLLHNKYEKGYMNGFSVGLRPVTWSDSEEYKLKGQDGPTLIESELIEVASATVPSNKFAVILYDNDGKILKLSFHKKSENMKKLALMLKLSENSTEAEIQGKIEEIQAESAAKDAQIVALTAENTTLKEAELKKASAAFEVKLSDKTYNLSDEQKENLRKLAKQDIELADKLLSNMPKVVNLHKVPDTEKPKSKYEGKTFKELQKEAPGYLAELKVNDYAAFEALYEAEFGNKPKQ